LRQGPVDRLYGFREEDGLLVATGAWPSLRG